MNMEANTNIVPKAVALTAEQADMLLKSGVQTTITVTTTKGFVDWALAHNTHNRALSQSTAKNLANMINEGKWFLTNQGLGFTRTGFLADGQHRLEAMKIAGYPPLPINVTFGMEGDAQLIIDRQRLRTAADGLALTTDIRLTRRSGGIIPWLWHIDNCTYRKLAMDPFVFRATAEKYCEALADVVDGGNNKGLSAGFFAPLVYLHAHGEPIETVKDFIQGVATGIGLGRGDPRLKYRNDFVVGTSRRTSAGRAAMFLASAQLYIAFAEGRPVLAYSEWTMDKAIKTLRTRARILDNPTTERN